MRRARNSDSKVLVMRDFRAEISEMDKRLNWEPALKHASRDGTLLIGTRDLINQAECSTVCAELVDIVLRGANLRDGHQAA